MNTEPVYWTTRDGKPIFVDDMDSNHVKNALKALIRHHAKQKKLLNLLIDEHNKKIKPKHEFRLNGEMAIAFNQDMEDAELDDDYYDGIHPQNLLV